MLTAQPLPVRLAPVKAQHVKSVASLLMMCAASVGLPGQIRPSSTEVTRSDGTLSITVHSYYPVRDILVRLGQEYGWSINYEDPIYPASDTVDVSVSSWRRDHPGERGFYVPKWEDAFSVHLPAAGEHVGSPFGILQGIVNEYNRSHESVKFRIQALSHSRFRVTGRPSGGRGIFDATSVAVNRQPTQGTQELARIINSCSAETGLTIVLGIAPMNALNHAIIAGGIGKLDCGSAINRVIAQVSPELVYQVIEDIADRQLLLSITATHKLPGADDHSTSSGPLQ